MCPEWTHRILRLYVDYHRACRTHLGLAKDTPLARPVTTSGAVIAIPQVGGLHHRYDRRAA